MAAWCERREGGGLKIRCVSKHWLGFITIRFLCRRRCRRPATECSSSESAHSCRSGLRVMIVFVCVSVQKDLAYVYNMNGWRALRKSCTFWGWFFHSFLPYSPSSTLFALTCDKPDGKTVFAVITIIIICLPQSKPCDESQVKKQHLVLEGNEQSYLVLCFLLTEEVRISW